MFQKYNRIITALPSGSLIIQMHPVEFTHSRIIIVSSLPSCSLDSSYASSSDTNLYDVVPMNSPAQQSTAHISEIVLKLQTHESNQASAPRSI